MNKKFVGFGAVEIKSKNLDGYFLSFFTKVEYRIGLHHEKLLQHSVFSFGYGCHTRAAHISPYENTVYRSFSSSSIEAIQCTRNCSGHRSG
jgi:hypothetical protein